MQDILKIALIIYGLIIGLMTAYSLSFENNVQKEEIDELEQALNMMGKRSLKGKKLSLLKFSKFSFIMYLVYTIPAILYFFSNRLGFISAVVLLVLEIYEFFMSRRKIKKAKKFKESVVPSKQSFVISVAHLLIIGVHIGLLI